MKTVSSIIINRLRSDKKSGCNLGRNLGEPHLLADHYRCWKGRILNRRPSDFDNHIIAEHWEKPAEQFLSGSNYSYNSYTDKPDESDRKLHCGRELIG